MSRLFVILMFSLILLVSCATPVPKAKQMPQDPKITEEDIPLDRKSSELPPIQPETQPPGPGSAYPNYTPPQTSTPVETGPKQPRRFIWRDKKGSDKGWESESSSKEQ